MIPELHRPVTVERIGPAGLDVTVEATTAECVALAVRMGLPTVLALTCTFHLEWDAAGTLLAYGHLVAHLTQTCVVSLDDFANLIDERFVVRCVPDGEEGDDGDPKSLDEIPSSTVFSTSAKPPRNNWRWPLIPIRAHRMRHYRRCRKTLRRMPSRRWRQCSAGTTKLCLIENILTL